MKYIIILTIICATSALAAPELELDNLWRNFKNDHNRQYASADEEAKRFEIFRANLQSIMENNLKYERGQTTYKMGINKFTDMTQEERVEKYLTKIEPPTHRDEAELPLTDVPESKDWAAEGMVTKIKDQEACGCCYAFASVAAIESGNAIVNKKLQDLSVQEVVDCSAGDIYLNHGCSGGIIEGSIHYVMDHGIVAEETYPYAGTDGNICSTNASKPIVTVKSYKNVPANETLLKQAVGGIGPVAACVDANTWFAYEDGILDGPCYDNATSHVILIVGYGTENGVDYWLVKNSWGTGWGAKGFGKVRRNNNNAFCLATYTAYPIMK
ncbi:unnamed protein product [Phyllotreta striolata]|uniref:Uncharacterized protein n=1 Tax=Phyllotreta striolata TaxID=444603 RepID=A0A9P0GU15_PHYSR|nr:unnamed protein product [Phyllotreta striolata]